MSYDESKADQVVETCLSISAFFEGSSFTPRYDNITGNFDDQGISCGCLQWAAGQGSLSHLLAECLSVMGNDKANGYFSAYGSAVVTNMSKMNGAQAKNFALANFVDTNKKVKPDALAAWKAFLTDDDVVATQRRLAKDNILKKAWGIADQFAAEYPDNMRAISFFFDVVVQSGGMGNSRGHVDPISTSEASKYTDAIAMARAQGKTWTADQWQAATDAEDLSKLLLHYAHQRALLSLPQWQWDTLARRGTIATRHGYVHGTKIDLTDRLP